MINVNYLSIIYILCGLSLFLFSLDQIKISLNNLFITKLKQIITNSVNTKFKSFLFGFLCSAIIQSSSGTTAISISLLSSKYIKPKDCLGIIIGANLGTCITTFITAINIDYISLFIIIISFILYLLVSKYKKFFILIIYIGIMLLGLDILNNGFNQIIYNKNIYTVIQNIQNSNTLSLLFGILSTSIIQSSSGIIGIVEGLYETHLTSLQSSLYIMLGANIGTTLTGYLATLNTSNQTKTIINMNLLFNIIGVVLFIIIFAPYLQFIRYMQDKYFINNLKFSIAFAHFIFNLISVILGYILFDLFIYFINKKKLPT